MIIRRDALRAALVATTKDDSRYFLHSVKVHSDGMLEATDGNMLMRVRDKYPQKDEEYPRCPNTAEEIIGCLTSILLPVPLAEKLMAALPKKATIPILNAVQIGLRDGKRIGVATDLEVPCVVDLEPANTDTHFPTTDRVHVAEGQRTPVIRLTLTAEMLTRLAKIATTVGRAKALNAITFEIPLDPLYQGTRPAEGYDGTRPSTPEDRVPDGNIASQIRVTIAGEDCSVEGVVMPCRN